MAQKMKTDSRAIMFENKLTVLEIIETNRKGKIIRRKLGDTLQWLKGTICYASDCKQYIARLVDRAIILNTRSINVKIYFSGVYL